MKITKPILLSALLALFLSGETGFCSWTLNSEFLLTLPDAFIDQEVDELLKTSGALTFNVPDQIVNEGFPVTLSGITANVSYPSTNLTTISSGQTWQVAATQIAAQINIAQLNTAQTVHEVINGVNLNLTLNASCSNIVIKVPAGAAGLSANVALAVGATGVQTTLSQFAMQWAQNAWQVSPFTCTGATGFEQLVTSQITQILSNPATFQPIVEQYIQNALNQSIATGLGQLFGGIKINTQRNDVLANVVVQKLSAIPGGYGASGTLSVQLPLATPGQNLQESSAALPTSISALNAGQAYLTLPEGLMTSLLAHIQDTSLLNFTFTSDNVPGLKGLIGSRFKQFFVFPDLFSFSTKTVFNFTTNDSSPVVALISDTMKTVDSFLSTQISGSFNVVMNAPKNGSFVHYVDLTMPFTSKATVSVAAGTLTCKITSPKIKVNASFDANYKKLYHPEGWIAAGTIGGGIQSALTAAPVTFKLPTINIQNLLTLQAVGVEHHADTQTFNLYLNNPN